MAKLKVLCPECKAEIDCLINVQSGTKEWEMNAKGKYKDLDEFNVDDGVNDWECPECEAVLATDEESALEILAGKKHEKV